MKALVVLSGGITQDGLLEWTKNRCDKAVELYTGNELIITSSAYTPHKPPFLNDGNPITEARQMADYILSKGVKPEHMRIEAFSLDTLGNAIFTRQLITEPEQVHDLTIITSSFHMPRSKLIFDYVFSLQPVGKYNLQYVEVSDGEQNQKAIKARSVKEQERIERFKKTMAINQDLKSLITWLFTIHNAYNYDLIYEKYDKILEDSY
ncbi:YdcF family protein [Candidatus Woesearchaeota archaeon]|nr:YdcF family protein [Candidatus Woesearchaeota archaeon]